MKIQFVRRENGEIVERGKIYEVLSTDRGWYRITDAQGDTCYYPGSLFDIVEPYPPAPEIHYTVTDDGEWIPDYADATPRPALVSVTQSSTRR